jgi:DNA-directed RNA polymerase specialized sigma24 family protein
MKAAYDWALAFARTRARGSSEVEEVLIDAATDALMWAQRQCTDAFTFVPLAKSAVRRWFGRALHRHKLKKNNRPGCGGLPEQVEGRHEKPTKPMLIEDLPDDLAFVVRLYMIDSFTCREIGHLTGRSHDTVSRMLKQAALIIGAGREVPSRRNGEKRFSSR